MGRKENSMKSIRKMTKALLGGWGWVVLLLIFALAGQAAAQTWTQLSPTGGPPSVRRWHTAVLNPNNNRMIVFGGSNATQLFFVPPSIALLNDVWVLSNADGTEVSTPTWTQLSTTGGSPSKRAVHTAVYDPNNNMMIVFAGNPNFGGLSGLVNDVWVLSNADGTEASTPTWTQLTTTGGPPAARWQHTSVYDSTNSLMIVFAGSIGSSGHPLLNDVWVLSNANGTEASTPTWTQLTTTGGTSILGRHAHTAVYDEANNLMTIFGGQNSSGLLNDSWVLSNANGTEASTPTWTQLSTTGGPPGARVTKAVYDPTSNRMTLFAGLVSGVDPVNDVWVLSNANGTEASTPAWTLLSPTGGPPAARDTHSAVSNTTSNRMTVFGGFVPSLDNVNNVNVNDVWVLADANGIVEPSKIPVALDIKPQSCPNPLNVKSKGKLPVAILGTPDFDVRTIDVLSVRLNGVAPVKSAFEDVTAPAFKIDPCDCEELDEDSFEDLVLKFDRQEIVATLEAVQDGDLIQLTLTGNLLESAGGTPIEGTDCILIKDKGKR